MGISFRKLIRLGPFSLNLSKSGLGVSTGVPGLRVGIGPRGVHASAGLPGTGLGYQTRRSFGALTGAKTARRARARAVPAEGREAGADEAPREPEPPEPSEGARADSLGAALGQLLRAVLTRRLPDP